MQTDDSLEKSLERLRAEEGVSEDEMAGQHHQYNEHELKQTPRDGEGQGGLGCCSPWVTKSQIQLGNQIQLNKTSEKLGTEEDTK